MSRLIDADAVILNYGGLVHISPYDFQGIAKYFAEQIAAAPTIDAVPVVRGEWLEFVGRAYHGVDDDGEVKWRDVSIFHCDKCGRKTVVKENFCPHCGADMREEQND